MSSLGSHFLLFYIIENNRLRQVKLESIGDLKLMGMLAEIIVNLVKKNTTSSKMANHIFYKIEDVNSTLDEYTLRCANTNTVFNVSITEIVYDASILFGLHPAQACYIGLEFSKIAKSKSTHSSTQNKTIDIRYTECRYGKFSIHHIDRQGNVCFSNKTTSEKFCMDPRDIILSKDILNEFDASQAFHLGIFAGFKIKNPIKEKETPVKNNIHYMRLVKNDSK